MENDEIILLAKNGDRSAFATLVRKYQSYAYSLAVRLLYDEAEAEDVVQDAFVRVWQNLGRYDPSARFTTWLYRIVTNLAVDRVRARNRRRWIPFRSDGEPGGADPQAQGDLQRSYEEKEMVSIVRRLTEDLPETQRMVFILRDLQELSVNEVCEITGLSEGSVKANLCYARRALRGRLVREFGVKGAI